MEEKQMARIEIKEANIGTKGKRYWWAYVDGQMLRAKNGVGRNFKTPEAAFAAASKAAPVHANRSQLPA